MPSGVVKTTQNKDHEIVQRWIKCRGLARVCILTVTTGECVLTLDANLAWQFPTEVEYLVYGFTFCRPTPRCDSA